MGGLNLLHPELLAGLAGCALPAVLHLIGRHPPQRVAFAPFDFLRATQARLARRESLRQVALWLLRTLALAALALALARPLPPQAAAAPDVPRRVAIVVDTSASMAYVHAGTALAARAQTQARDVLEHLRPGDAATVVATNPRVAALLPAPTLELAAARAAVARLPAPAGVADYGAALALAAAQVGGAGTVVLIGDLARGALAGLQPLPQPAPRLRLIDAAARAEPTAPLANLALVGCEVGAAPELPLGREVRVTVHNYGAAAVAARPLRLCIDGIEVQHGYVDVAAGARVDKVFTYRFAAPGTYVVTARLAPGGDDDGLVSDDAVRRVVQVLPPVRVLAVNGEPRTTPYEDELFFVERALAAVPQGDPPIDVQICEPAQLGEAGCVPADFDVVLLANVGTLAPAAAGALRGFVAGGGGLLFGLGGQVHFEAANQALAGLLPHPLRDVHLAADAAADGAAVALGQGDWEHPVLRGLGAAAEEGLQASQTARYFNVDAGVGRAAHVLLRFADGAPALLEAQRADRGRVLLWASSLDLDDTDLPLRPAFVPLLQRSVRYVARALEVPPPAQVVTGGAAALTPPAAAEALALLAPSGARLEAPVAPGDAAAVRLGPLDEVGLYRGAARLPGAAWAEVPTLDVAVALPPEESDFAPLQADAVAAALAAGGAPVSLELGPARAGDPLAVRGYAPALLCLLALAFVAESALAARR